MLSGSISMFYILSQSLRLFISIKIQQAFCWLLLFFSFILYLKARLSNFLLLFVEYNFRPLGLLDGLSSTYHIFWYTSSIDLKIAMHLLYEVFVNHANFHCESFVCWKDNGSRPALLVFKSSLAQHREGRYGNRAVLVWFFLPHLSLSIFNGFQLFFDECLYWWMNENIKMNGILFESLLHLLALMEVDENDRWRQFFYSLYQSHYGK